MLTLRTDHPKAQIADFISCHRLYMSAFFAWVKKHSQSKYTKQRQVFKNVQKVFISHYFIFIFVDSGLQAYIGQHSWPSLKLTSPNLFNLHDVQSTSKKQTFQCAENIDQFG